jgi:hypothetical protein
MSRVSSEEMLRAFRSLLLHSKLGWKFEYGGIWELESFLSVLICGIVLEERKEEEFFPPRGGYNIAPHVSQCKSTKDTKKVGQRDEIGREKGHISPSRT